MNSQPGDHGRETQLSESDVSNFPDSFRDLRVQDVIDQYRDKAISMNFDQMIELQKFDVNISWMICEAKKYDDKKLGDASILTIAHGLTLQQLGYHVEAKECFHTLMSKIGLPMNKSGLESLHDRLGDDWGDDALALLFRIDTPTLGTDRCGSVLQLAENLLRKKRNKAKFFWRSKLNDVLIGKTIDAHAFEQQYFELTGQNWGAAPGNAAIIPLSQALSRAKQEPLDRSARYWDQALYWAIQSSKHSQKNLFNSEIHNGHLITHTCLATLYEVISYKWCIAVLRGKKEQMLELAMIWKDIDNLRHDARIRFQADGFRELHQINVSLFGKTGLNIASIKTERPKHNDVVVMSRIERLRNLTNEINNLQ